MILPERTGAEILVECLRAEGIKDVFGLIGSACIDITDAIYRTPGMRFIPSQHEQGAAYAADGYARAKQEPAVCLVTVGPGATNMFTGIAQAQMESSPVIAISGEVATTVRGRGRSNWHEIEQLDAYKTITKRALRVDRVERIPEVVREAFRVATSGRPGPVYIGIPRDVQVATSAVEVPPPQDYRPAGRVRGDAEQISRVAELLLQAQNPMLLAGGGAIWSQARDKILQLMELLVMPGASTPSHKGIIPDDHPLGLGSLGQASSPPALVTVREADLILALGCTFSEKTTDRYGYNIIPPGAKIVHVDIDPTEIGKSYPVAVGIVGDVKAVVQDLICELEQRGQKPVVLSDHPRAQRVAELKESWREELAHIAAEGMPGGVSRAQVVTAVRRALDHDALVVSEAGGTCLYTEFALECYHPYIIPGDFSAMGSGLCMAIGVKVAFPDRQVLTISGDGATMMVLPEIYAAVENQVPFVAVVVHNDIYSNIHYKQDTVFGGRYIGSQHPYPSLASVAQELGAWGEKVEVAADLEPAIKRALACGQPAVVEVYIDPSDRVPPSKTYLRWVAERQMPAASK